MKKVHQFRLGIAISLLLLGFSVSPRTASGQTTLAAGDIAFSGYVASAAVPDQFSFVLLKTVTANTVIKFTDFGWRSNTNSFNSGAATESEITLTCVAMPAGTEVVFDGTTATKAGGGSAGTVAYSSGGSFNSLLNLSSSGDQIFAYQGTFASPTFITGIHMNVFVTPGDPNNSDAASWDGVLGAADPNINGSSSTKPVALTTGTDAIWIGTTGDSTSEKDNARFNCGPNVSTAALARAALNNKANWTATDNNPPGFTLPTGCAFLVVSAANVAVSGRIRNPAGGGIRNVIVMMTDVNGVKRTAISNAFGYYRFDDVRAGGVYTVGASARGYRFTTQVVNVSDELTGIDLTAQP